MIMSGAHSPGIAVIELSTLLKGETVHGTEFAIFLMGGYKTPPLRFHIVPLILLVPPMLRKSS